MLPTVLSLRTSPTYVPAPTSPPTTPTMLSSTGGVPAEVTHFVKVTFTPPASARANCVGPTADRPANAATSTSAKSSLQPLIDRTFPIVLHVSCVRVFTFHSSCML